MLSVAGETVVLGSIREVEGIVVMTGLNDLLLLVEDVADGSVAEGTISGIIEIGEEWLVENEFWDGQPVVLSGNDVLQFVLLWERVSTLCPWDIVSAGLGGGDLCSGGHSVVDPLVVNVEVGDLNNWVNLFNGVLGADNVLSSNVLLNIVSQRDIDTWNLNTDGLLDPFSWLELEDVFNSLAGQELVEGLLGQNKDNVLVFTVGL